MKLFLQHARALGWLADSAALQAAGRRSLAACCPCWGRVQLPLMRSAVRWIHQQDLSLGTQGIWLRRMLTK